MPTNRRSTSRIPRTYIPGREYDPILGGGDPNVDTLEKLVRALQENLNEIGRFEIGSGAADDDVMVYAGGAWTFVAKTSFLSVNDLTDVVITTPLTNDVLVYQGGQWVNAPMTELIEFSDLSDVDVSLGVEGDFPILNSLGIWTASNWTVRDFGLGAAPTLGKLDVQGNVFLPVAPTASANKGLLNLGSGGWTGAAGHFAGIAAGTGLAMNFAAGYAGHMIHGQVNGVEQFVIGAFGGSTFNVNFLAGVSKPFAFNSTLVTFTSDANKTLTQGEYVNPYLDIQTDAVLTAQRDLIVPLGIGEFFIVRNRNAQNIRVIGPSGTGTVVASGRIAILAGSGANIIRVTPDTVP